MKREIFMEYAPPIALSRVTPAVQYPSAAPNIQNTTMQHDHDQHKQPSGWVIRQVDNNSQLTVIKFTPSAANQQEVKQVS